MRVVLCSIIICSVFGCSETVSVKPCAPSTTNIVVDASNTIRIIESIANEKFVEDRVPVRVQSEFNSLVTRAYIAVQKANNSLRYDETLSRENLDIIFKDYNQAYDELVSLCNSLGITDKAKDYNLAHLPLPLTKTYNEE